MKDAKPPGKKCKVPECDKDAKWNGICQSCYGQAKQLIEDGKTSWVELAKMGLCELVNKPLLNAFLKMKADEPASAPAIDDDSGKYRYPSEEWPSHV